MLRKGWSITALLVAVVAVPAFVMSIVLMMTNYVSRIDEVEADLRDRGRIIAAALAEASRYAVVSGNRAALEEPVASLLKSDLSVAIVEIWGSDGQLLLRRSGQFTSPSVSQPFRHPIRSQVLAVELLEGAPTSVAPEARGTTIGQRMGAGQRIGEALVFMSPEPLMAAKRQAIHISSLFILAAAAFSCLLGFGLGKAIRMPLSEVMNAVRQVQAGNLSIKLPAHRHGELGELQAAINDMAVNLSVGRDRLEEKVRQRTLELEEAVQLAEAAHADKRRLIARETQKVEDERRRIALDLHDHVGSSLVGARMIALDIAAAAKDLGSQGTDLNRSATRLAEIINNMYVGTRSIVKQLRPEVIDTLGLRGAIAELIDTYDANNADCRFALHVVDPFPDFRGQIAMISYRLIQEAVTNSIKHADATEIVVHLASMNSQTEIQIEIWDNGVGFDVSPAEDESGLGLVGMRERIDSVGGTMVIHSSPYRGTKVVLDLPITRPDQKDS